MTPAEQIEYLTAENDALLHRIKELEERIKELEK